MVTSLGHGHGISIQFSGFSRHSRQNGSQLHKSIGVSGSQPGVQTLKSLVEVTLPEESSRYR